MFDYVSHVAHFACVHFSLVLPVTACDIWETYVPISDGAAMVSNTLLFCVYRVADVFCGLLMLTQAQ